VQATYRCAVCRGASDVPRHCGQSAALTGGRRWVTNDLVNAVATGFGALLAVLAAAVG
jgi:hypothetical protein